MMKIYVQLTYLEREIRNGKILVFDVKQYREKLKEIKKTIHRTRSKNFHYFPKINLRRKTND